MEEIINEKDIEKIIDEKTIKKIDKKIIDPLIKNEKNSNGPIIKSKNGNVKEIKIGYFCSKNKVAENKKIIEAIISNGMNREVKFLNGDGIYYFNTSGGDYKLASGEPKIKLQSYYLDTFLTFWEENTGFFCDYNVWVVDENCGEELLKKLEQTVKGKKGIPYLIFVKRNKDGSGFVDTANYTVEADGVVNAIADFVNQCDEYIEEHKTICEKHKGKFVLGGLSLVVFAEELWRNGFFGGKKTNEKTKDNKHLPKVSEKKNNSAPT